MGYTKQYLEWLEQCRDEGKNVYELAKKLNVNINSFGLMREFSRDTLVETIKRFRHQPPRWDVFLSHASEDKENVVRPLYNELCNLGFKVWFDISEYSGGEGWPGILYRFIHEGVACSRVGVIVLSPKYVQESKIWTTDEYFGLRLKGGSTLFYILHDAEPQLISQLDDELSARIRGGETCVLHGDDPEVISVLDDNLVGRIPDGGACITSTAATTIEKIAQKIADFIKAVSASSGCADCKRERKKQRR